MMAATTERVVIHVDLDAFFVQVERHRNPLLNGTPMAVQQHQDIIAVSYEARALGVKKHMAPAVVRSRFPEVKLVHVPVFRGKVTYKSYRRASHAVFTLLKGFCKRWERASIDEAYFEPLLGEELFLPPPSPLAAPAAAAAKEGGEAGLLPPRELGGGGGGAAAAGAAGAGGAAREGPCFPLARPPPPPQEDAGGSAGDIEAYKPSSQSTANRWLAAGGALGARMRAAAAGALRYQCSVGVGPSKLLAKVASGMAKPEGIKIIYTHEVQQIMVSLRISDLQGCKEGSKAYQLFREHGIDSMQSLQKLSSLELSRMLGPTLGSKVHQACRGIDGAALRPPRPQAQVSTQMALTPVPLAGHAIGKPESTIRPIFLWELERLREHLETLAMDLVERTQEIYSDQEFGAGRWPQSCTVSAVINNNHTRKTHSFPFPERSQPKDEAILQKKILAAAVLYFQNEAQSMQPEVKMDQKSCNNAVIKLILSASYKKIDPRKYTTSHEEPCSGNISIYFHKKRPADCLENDNNNANRQKESTATGKASWGDKESCMMSSHSRPAAYQEQTVQVSPGGIEMNGLGGATLSGAPHGSSADLIHAWVCPKCHGCVVPADDEAAILEHRDHHAAVALHQAQFLAATADAPGRGSGAVRARRPSSSSVSSLLHHLHPSSSSPPSPSGLAAGGQRVQVAVERRKRRYHAAAAATASIITAAPPTTTTTNNNDNNKTRPLLIVKEGDDGQSLELGRDCWQNNQKPDQVMEEKESAVVGAEGWIYFSEALLSFTDPTDIEGLLASYHWTTSATTAQQQQQQKQQQRPATLSPPPLATTAVVPSPSSPPPPINKK